MQLVKISFVFVAFLTSGNSQTTKKCIWFIGSVLYKETAANKPNTLFRCSRGSGVTKVLQNLADIDNFAKSKPLQGANCQDSIGFNAISDMRRFGVARRDWQGESGEIIEDHKSLAKPV